MTYYRRTSVSVVTFEGSDAPQRAQEGLVGPEFFELLAVAPLIGRAFSKDEFTRRQRVVVLSEGLWQERFARSEAAIGQTLSIGGEAHVVVGVMPQTFQLPTRDTRFWRPLSVLPLWPGAQRVRASDNFEVLGRLAPGVSMENAKAEMHVIARRLGQMHEVNRDIDIRVVPLFEFVVGARTSEGVWLGFGAVLSLLLIACANVGGLLLARAAKRRREMAVRCALGASRARLVLQLLADSVTLWALASIAGATLAYGLIRLLVVYGPRIPRMDEAGLDLAALSVAFIGGLVAVVVCGTIPAFVTPKKADASSAFGTRDETALPRHRLQDVLVTAQIAGALTLLVGAVLFAQSFLRAQSEDPGYPADNLLIVRLDLPRTSYPERPDLASFFRQARERIGRLPGVVSVGAITDFFIRRNAGQWVTVDERAAAPDARLAIEGVTPGFFRGAGIGFLEGRDFEDRDYETNAPDVFIVSESLARRFWPGESALGKRIVSGTAPPRDGQWGTVVGVIKDIRRESLDVKPILLAFEPSFLRGMDMTIRMATNIESMMPLVRTEIRAIDRALPVTYVPAAGRLWDRLGERRFQSHALGIFAGIAVLLAAAGLYASFAYQVALRTREIGIRTALGADRRSIVGMILGKGVRLAGIGAVAGTFGAAAVARILQTLLYETSAVNPLIYAAAVGLVLLVAVIAVFLPALRAAAVNPMTALRND